MSDFGWLCWLAGCAGVCGWGHVAQCGFSTSRLAGAGAERLGLSPAKFTPSSASERGLNSLSWMHKWQKRKMRHTKKSELFLLFTCHGNSSWNAELLICWAKLRWRSMKSNGLTSKVAIVMLCQSNPTRAKRFD